MFRTTRREIASAARWSAPAISPPETSETRSARLPELLDDAGVERRNVVRLAARRQIAVGDHFLVDPVCAGIREVGLDRRIRRHAPATRGPGLDHEPWPVANGRDRLLLVEEGLGEGDGSWAHAQFVG